MVLGIGEKYNNTLLKNPDLSEKTFSYIRKEYERNKIMMGNRLLPFFLTPNFISESRDNLIMQSSERMAGILEKIGKNILRKSHESRLNVINRMDFFFHEGKIKFIEFNADSPSGAGRLDIINKIFSEIPIISGIKENKEMRESLLEALFNSYKEWGGKKEKPTIALIDWKGVKTISDQKLIAQYFNGRGFRTILADPRELKYKKGKMFSGETEIDILYKRVIIKELLDKKEECRDLFSAISDNSIFISNPLESGILGEKKLISRMASGEFDKILTEDEKSFLREYLPWSKEVNVNLKEKIISEKNKLVLKPDEGYGGEGVKIGKFLSEEEWKKAVDISISDSGWTVQEYIDVPAIKIFDKGKITKKFMSMSSFVFGGKYAGCMTRVSDDPVVNTSKGGGIIPTFVLKKG
ncbi:MAG: glutathionylspermidine synthase family protein [Candidatus Aenigmarchaeota archaeon]|nr:glutathionylspermidine synthase family protein [Candidatus Aenigmarchaeota archaeon]